jgi:hypothetical protein
VPILGGLQRASTATAGWLNQAAPALGRATRALPNAALSTLELTPRGYACTVWASTAHLPGENPGAGVVEPNVQTGSRP